MGKKILFSPIGGNDPVSSQTEHDGSMLHICRYYKPDIVYLYLSKEMVERHKRDNRYGYCIEKLGELLGHKFEVCFIEKEDLVEVQEYDFYYEEYQPMLAKIEAELEPEDQIYVNIASGTPAMKSALLMLAVMGGQRIQAVQVNTPARAIQQHAGKDSDYDPEYYWEVNQDNQEGAVNRCVEPKCQNMVDILKKNILEKHIAAYNYAAAVMLAEEMRSVIGIEAYDLIRMAEARRQLDLSGAKKIALTYQYDLFPVKQGNQLMLFEYALNLKLKVQKKEYADFIRAISPILTDLFDIILKVQCKIDISQYCVEKHSGTEWSVEKLESDDTGREILQVLNAEFRNGFRGDTKLAASNLKPILLHYLKDAKVKELVEDVRYIEEKIRNIAAHEIASITNEQIKVIIGRPTTVEQIFKKIQGLVNACKIAADKEAWNSYDTMNEYLIEKLKQQE